MAMKVLVTGATGYVGGRLVPKLLEQGHTIRVIAREPHRLDGVPWVSSVEIIQGDLLNPDDVRAAVAGQDVVYYLVHSMSSAGDFEALERQVATSVASESAHAGVSRIVYLGGLHPQGPLSRHLGSRKEVGDILLASGVPTIALQAGVIDLVASSQQQLLAALQGRVVEVAGVERTLALDGLTVNEHPVDWRSEFLAVITNPNIAYVLLLIGVYGLIIEFYSPGIGVPGVMGALCLLLALYAFQVLPVSYSGLALIFLGVGLMATEAFTPSFGILGLGGLIAFVVGSIMLMDTRLPGYQIAMPMIAAFSAVSVAVLVFALGMVMRARRQEVRTGIEHLVGEAAVIESVGSDGVALARLDGELWEVACADTLGPQDRVVVSEIDGLTLQVRKENGVQS